jgi:hypothetical protein
MKITTEQLRKIIREEIRKVKEGYEPIKKNMGYVEDKTEPSEYTADGAGLLKGESKKKKK